MALIDEAVRSILLSNPAVYELVGTRIYPLVLPLDCTFPAISYSKPSSPHNRVVKSPRFQIDCWDKANNFTAVQKLSLAVEAALNGYSGTVSGITIEGIYPLISHDLSDDNFCRVSYDFSVIYRT